MTFFCQLGLFKERLAPEPLGGGVGGQWCGPESSTPGAGFRGRGAWGEEAPFKRDGGTRALILVPTRELAVQCLEVVSSVFQRGPCPMGLGRRVNVLVGVFVMYLWVYFLLGTWRACWHNWYRQVCPLVSRAPAMMFIVTDGLGYVGSFRRIKPEEYLVEMS